MSGHMTSGHRRASLPGCLGHKSHTHQVVHISHPWPAQTEITSEQKCVREGGSEGGGSEGKEGERMRE